MTLSPKRLKAFAALLVGLGIVELASTVHVIVFGPFAAHVGPFRISGQDATKLFNIGVLAACAAVWLFEQARPDATTSPTSRLLRWVALAAVVASGVSLAAPELLPAFPLGHDAGVHPTHAFLFHRALAEGQIPVRWVEWIQDGLGQPLFSYYQVGFYYAVELIHAFGPSLELSIKLAVVAFWLAGAVFMFLLFKPFGVLPGALAGSVFAWSPYLMLDAYVRTAYTELASIALAPGVLWSIDRLLRTGGPLFVCALALTTCLFLLSHLLGVMIVAPVSAAYIVGCLVVRRAPAQRLRLVVLGIVLGIGMAGFYVIPALTELEHIKAGGLTASYYDFRQHFVNPRRWADWSWGYGGSAIATDAPMSMQIGIVQWLILAAAVSLACVAAARRRFTRTHAALVGWLVTAGAAMFMMTSTSLRIWNAVAPLRFIQFPWRLLLVPTLACAALAAIVLSMVRNRTAQALIVVAAVSLQWSVTRDYRREAWHRERADMCIDRPSRYWRSDCRRWAFRESSFDPVSAANAQAAEGRWTIAQGRAEVVATSLEQARLALTIRAITPIQLVINSPFVPGWTLSLDDRAVDLGVRPGSGFMEVGVPAGTHRIDAAFRRTRIRLVADLLTVASFIVWATIAFKSSRLRSRFNHDHFHWTNARGNRSP